MKAARPATLIALAICATAITLVAAAIGPYQLELGETVRAFGATIAKLLSPITALLTPIAERLGPIGEPLTNSGLAQRNSNATQPITGPAALIEAVRLPRALAALFVRASLGIAGAAMQGVLGNPLAEPGITGVSAGAAVVAVLIITVGATSISPLALPLGAFIGALAAVFIVQLAGRTPASLLLIGIALNAFLGAVISAIVANAADAERARSAMFWLNGDFTGMTLQDVGLVIIPLLLGIAVVIAHTRALNLLAAGDATAATSGLNVTRTRQIILAAAALTTAAGVAITGIISFVGLVVPHIVRLIWGDDHRFLLPASALLGGIGLVLADTAARTLWQPISLQTGTVTALIGAPFLLFLVIKAQRRHAL